jgi:hypothetical protein
MSKFVYEANEVEFVDSQCDLCIYRLEGQPCSCKKYQEKPAEILKNEKKCPYVRTSTYIDL